MFRKAAPLVFLILVLGCAPQPGTNGTTSEVVGQASLRPVRIVDNRLEGARTQYPNYRTIADPTGTAPVPRVERFELRGGDCVGGDCDRDASSAVTGPITRARVEKVIGVNFGDGDSGIFEYSIYFPSTEFNHIPALSTVFGQLFALEGNDFRSSGTDIFALDKTDSSNGVFAITKQRDRTQNMGRIGDIGTAAFPYDEWIDIRVEFRLSSTSDGFVQAYVNGRPVSRIEGVTIAPSGRLEYRYGIYQNISDSAVSQFGSKDNIPAQVVYYANHGIRRAEFQ